VRAKITALTARAAAAETSGDTTALRQQYDDYLDCARRALSTTHPILILMYGLSGSGKSWIAERLAPVLGAVHLRSDVERKRLAGIAQAAHSESGLEQGLYSREATTRVYQHLVRCAGDTLAGGYTTIVDATFQRREDRAQFHDLAVELGVAACIVKCEAPPEALRARINARRQRGGDPSDADLSVLRWQEVHCEPIQPDESLTVFEALTTRSDVVDTLTRQIGALAV
jgi:predicted kinase